MAETEIFSDSRTKQPPWGLNSPWLAVGVGVVGVLKGGARL